MNLHTETMMRYFPGMGICAMENGGMMFTEDGDYVDAIDVLLPTRDGRSIDVVDGDGDKGRVSIPYYDSEDMFAESDISETEEQELDRLVAEQAHDDATTTFVKIDLGDEDEINPSHSGSTERFDGGYNEGCQYSKSGYRNRGKKPEYKDRRKRAAGSGKVRNIPTVISC